MNLVRPSIPVLVAGAVLLASPSPADGDGQWQPETSLNLARQEVGAARIGDDVYVVGGLLDVVPFQATDAVERYDVDLGTWTTVAPLPQALDHMGVAAHAGKLYVVGGFAGDFQARGDLFVYDPAADSWSTGAPMPKSRGGCWAVTHLDRIYVFGGVGPADNPTKTTQIYDPASDSWSLGAAMPTAREHLNAIALGDEIYVLGGRSGFNAFAANEVYRPDLDQWQVRAPMPTARSAMAAAAWGGRIYAMGGEVPILHAVNETYDPRTDTWTSGPPMPIPRHGIAAVTLDDRILLPAGGIVQGLDPTSAVDSFIPDPCPGWFTFCGCASGPCGNSDPDAGCVNSTGQGSRLAVSGSVSIAADDLVLTADRLPPDQFGLFFMGRGEVRAPLGDGLRCVGADAGFFRFAVGHAGAAGVIAQGPGTVGFATANFGPAGQIEAGATWVFQCWYRDPPGPCGGTFNTSPAAAVTFVQ